MTLTAGTDAPAKQSDRWPTEVQLIISALAAGEDGARVPASPVSGLRDVPRMAFRVLADLHLFSDAPDAEPWRLYTRDVSSRSLGFITPHRLPLGYGGTVELATPDGNVIAINCTLLRCREITSGWFEGALYFNREQPAFAAAR
jgi:hypothetical protein